MVDYVAMGKRIRRFREKYGWTQTDLAAKISMSNTTISHIECGQGKHEFDTYIKIANALNVSMDMLLCDNLVAAAPIYHQEMSELLTSCSTAELRFICESIPPLLTAYRRSHFEKTSTSGEN